MKKITKLLGILLTLAVFFGFASCSNSGEDGSWDPVSNKSDLIGTWKGSIYVDGVKGDFELYVAQNYSGHSKSKVDYSKGPVEFKAIVQDLLNQIQAMGGTYTKSGQEFTANLNFTSTQFASMSKHILIHSSKKRIKMNHFGLVDVEYTKQ